MKKNKNLIPFCIGALLILIMVSLTYFSLNKKISNKTLPLIEAIEKEPNISKDKEDTSIEISLTSLGNLIVHQSQINGAKDLNGNYNFDKSFQYISPLLKNDSLSLGIVEGSFNGGIPTGYPLFNIPDSFLPSLKTAGVDVINFATNHSIDKGVSGFNRSLHKISENNFKIIGSRKSVDVPRYLIYDLKGYKIGFFAYTFRTAANNGNSINSIPLPPELAPLINSFDYNNLSSFDKDVKNIVSDMQKEGVQFIISSIHWGDEYKTTPNKYQKEMAKILNNTNIDVILGGHPHVIQPYETLTSSTGKETLVFYSQGNTLSNQCYEEIGNYNSEDGIIVSLTLGIKDKQLYLKKYDIIPTWVHRRKQKNGTLSHEIIPALDALKSPTDFDLSDDAITKLNNSLNRTKSIIGSNNISSLLDVNK